MQEHFLVLCELLFLKHPVLVLQMQYILLPFKKHLRWLFFKFFHLSSIPNSSDFFLSLCWLCLSLLWWEFPTMVYLTICARHLPLSASPWVPQTVLLSGGSERRILCLGFFLILSACSESEPKHCPLLSPGPRVQNLQRFNSWFPARHRGKSFCFVGLEGPIDLIVP